MYESYLGKIKKICIKENRNTNYIMKTCNRSNSINELVQLETLAETSNKTVIMRETIKNYLQYSKRI